MELQERTISIKGTDNLEPVNDIASYSIDNKIYLQFLFLEMRKCILILIGLLLNIVLWGQNQNFRINADRDQNLFYFFDGLWFQPANEWSNNPDFVLCDDYTEEFYLNGLKLDKESFVSLRLSPHELSNDRTTAFSRGSSKQGYGLYEYAYYEGETCARVIYRVNVRLPIFLNEIELSTIEKQSVMSKIILSEILSIEKKRFMFFWKRIYIETKSNS